VTACDTTEYLLDLMAKYAEVGTYSDYRETLEQEKPAAALIATPSKFHSKMVQAARIANCRVSCER